MAELPRLTSLSPGGGCACKLGPADLGAVLATLPPIVDPNVLVGFATHDDAAIYRVDATRALALTIDVFTPVVDDPREFGRIAATNALSDVYAMGARPLCALAFAGFPKGVLPLEILGEILAGGAAQALAAGAPVVGGHTIDDPAPKYGLAVIGDVHPERVLTNAGARAGDVLVLTKAIGTGVVTHAIKQGKADAAHVAAAIASMTRLNAEASRAAIEHGAHAATDVTGFGLLGHLGELALASGLRARVDVGAVPWLPGALAYAEAGGLPGGSRRNAEHMRPRVTAAADVAPARLALLADAQTSGGLLLALAPERVDAACARLRAGGDLAAVIGGLEVGVPGTIAVGA